MKIKFNLFRIHLKSLTFSDFCFFFFVSYNCMLNCFLLAVLLWYRITSKLFCFIINNFSLAQNKYSFSFFSIHTVSKIVQVYLVVFHFVITFLILKLVNTKKMENTFTYMRRLLFLRLIY